MNSHNLNRKSRKLEEEILDMVELVRCGIAVQVLLHLKEESREENSVWLVLDRPGDVSQLKDSKTLRLSIFEGDRAGTNWGDAEESFSFLCNDGKVDLLIALCLQTAGTTISSQSFRLRSFIDMAHGNEQEASQIISFDDETPQKNCCCSCSKLATARKNTQFDPLPMMLYHE